MNDYGFFCERVIRDLLEEIGIPHKNSRNGCREWYWWASPFEDKALGLDCWITLRDCGEVAVDFTVISIRNEELLQQKVARALGRGIIPIILEQGMLLRAADGSYRALEEFGQEIRFQISLKLKQFSGNRMTRELAAQLKQKRRLASPTSHSF